MDREADQHPHLRLSVATPPGWWDLPLDPITRSGEIQRLVARRMADAGEAERAEMAGVLGAAADAAHRAGAVMASQFAVVGDGVHVAASMTLSVRPASAPPLLQAADDRVGERQVAVDTVTMGPSGVARRKRCLRSLDLGRPEAQEVLSVEYSLPVAGWAVEVVATFSSPTVEASGEMVALFDAVAATVTFEVDGQGDRIQ